MDCFLASTPKSECSSGCESGWTLYLGSSFISSHSNRENGNFVDGKRGFSEEKRSEEEEEDLSMVSDASSGPPHCSEEEDCMSNINDNNAARCFFHAGDATLCKSRSRKKQKTLENHCRMKKAVREKSSLLDDTASSPVFEMDLPDVSSDHYKVASRVYTFFYIIPSSISSNFNARFIDQILTSIFDRHFTERFQPPQQSWFS